MRRGVLFLECDNPLHPACLYRLQSGSRKRTLEIFLAAIPGLCPQDFYEYMNWKQRARLGSVNQTLIALLTSLTAAELPGVEPGITQTQRLPNYMKSKGLLTMRLSLRVMSSVLRISSTNQKGDNRSPRLFKVPSEWIRTTDTLFPLITVSLRLVRAKRRHIEILYRCSTKLSYKGVY